MKRKKERSLSREVALEAAWSNGYLSYKLFDYQKPLYDALIRAIENPECLKYVLNCARRYGKTTILILIALEFALQNPGSQIRFAAPTQKALKKIILPIFRMLTADCPRSLKPKWHSQDGMYVFANGSEIHLAGTDGGNAENLRGTSSDLNIVDEAGFCDDLDYILKDILTPQTLTTGGKTLLASTPPRTPAHDFYEIAQQCIKDGYYSTFTIYDNESIDEKTLNKYAKEAGGLESTTFKREYLCQFVVDENLSIIREWSDKYITDTPRDEFYQYYHKYAGMDIGVRDLTAAVFGHYNFREATLYIEDEFDIQGNAVTTKNIADLVSSKEKELWPNMKAYRRISDNNNLILLQDLQTMHSISFMPTNKDNLEAMINELRLMVAAGRIKIHPRCIKTIGCLKYGVWNTKKSEFARSKTYGHFDHLAALVYLVRNLDLNTNPIPTLHNKSISTHFIPNYQGETEVSKQIKKLFHKPS